MTVAVIADLVDSIDTALVDIPDGASEAQVIKTIKEETDWDPDSGPLQWFELEPSAVERLMAITWPSWRDVSTIFADAQAAETGRHQALVYAAFAKGGPVRVNALNEKLQYGE